MPALLLTPLRCFLAAAALLTAACIRTPRAPESPPKPVTVGVSGAPRAAGAEAGQEAGAKPADVDLSRAPAPSAPPPVTELLEEDLVVGKGAEARSGDTVKVHYTGKLLDGTKFDSSHDRGQPFVFTIGRGMVIQGWDEGVPGMKPGGKRKLTIPSEKAYGKSGSPPKIPPDAPLEFEVELIEIVK